MDLSKENVKKIRWLIIFTAVVVVACVNYKMVVGGLGFLLNIIFPFVLGGAMAFIINAPMHFFEQHMFYNPWMKDKKFTKKMARPCSLLLALLMIVGIVLLVIFVVVPELGSTFVSLGKNISDFVPKIQVWAEQMFHDNKEIVAWVNSLEFNWDKMIQTAVDFLKSGASNVLSSTYAVAKTVISGVANFFIGFVFACYIVLQKEKLNIQVKKVCYAFLKEPLVKNILSVCSLAYKTFLNFLTGQCVEAVILGIMFFVAMTIFRFPYAMLVGILIAFTALIPIFGAFIGCVVGAFLILMVNPLQAVAFVILFLVLQQVEGNLIYPHVVGNSVGLPSIWVLMAVTVGGSLFGVVGMLIFIPITSVLYALLRGLVYERLKQKRIRVE